MHNFLSFLQQAPPYAFLRNGRFEDKDLRNITVWEAGNYVTPNGMSTILKSGDGAPDWESTQYNQIVVNETKAFVEEQIELRPEQPFFTYVALGAVHKPHTPAYKYMDGTPLEGQHPSKHMDVLKEVDKVVGSLTDHLRDQGVLENTIVIFTSDNGGLGVSRRYGQLSNGPLRENKGSIYEGGHTIPMIMRWDNGLIPKGEKRSHLVGLSDVFATLTDLVGIPKPRSQAVDSISFADYVLHKNKNGLRKHFGIWRYIRTDHTHSALRWRSMKLVYDHETNKSELYDLSNDLSEKTDISEQKKWYVKKMKEHLLQIGPCIDRPGRFDVKLRDSKATVQRSCAWFGRQKQRCGWSHDARIYCGKSCASYEKVACTNLVEV